MRTRLLLPLIWIALAPLPACTADEVDTAGAAVHVAIENIADAADVRPVDGLKSAGQPDQRALQIFKEAGYAAVIDLRGPDEERGIDEVAAAGELGLDYISLPIVGPEAISYDNARKLDALLEQYDEPVLVHCGSGNRVGALLALRRSLDGASDGEALQYGKDAGLSRLEPVVRERLEAAD